MYEVLRDFSAPFTTIVVAVFVGILSWRHNKRQTEIAQEKLKIDLFERRYAIYTAARELLEYVSTTEPEDITWKEVQKYLTTIHEAPFFFATKH